MFSFDHFASANARPKRIPPRPTPLSFPPCPELSSPGSSVLPLDQLEELFRLKNVRFLTQDRLLSVNLNVENVPSAESLIPGAFLPPASWKKKPSANDDTGKSTGPSSHQMLSNGAAVPGHEAFFNRMIELTYSNQDAYGAVSRRPPPPGQAPIRIAQFRRFWMDLQHVASFWDTSEDNLDYDDADVKQAIESQDIMPSPIATKKANTGMKPSKATDPRYAPMSETASGSMSKTTESSAGPAVVYTGLRHSTGSAMPSKHREDLVRTFMEPIAWSFGCVLERTVSQPYLHIGTTRLVADHAMRAFRGPQDRQRSRAKVVEGPLMALQCTHETDFSEKRVEVEYLARELCALLVVAQERHREGKIEAMRGSGQWWVDRRRWGGGTGDVMGIPLLEDDGSIPNAEERRKEEDVSMSSSKPKTPSAKEVKQQMKKTLLARSQKPPGPIWEKRVDYIRIGKAPDDEHDTVYLISCLNHHLALSRLRVHSRFLDFLTDPDPTVEAQDESSSWYGLWLTRSRWYDMFDPDDRVEILCALWGVMGWLMRDMGPAGNDRAPNPDEMMDS